MKAIILIMTLFSVIFLSLLVYSLIIDNLILTFLFWFLSSLSISSVYLNLIIK